MDQKTWDKILVLSKNITPPPFGIDDHSKKHWDVIWESAWKSILYPGGTSAPLPKQDYCDNCQYIYVFRHGQSNDNLRRVFSGWRDTKLTKDGILGAEILSQKIKSEKVDLCITSSLIRSKDTARIGLSNNKNVKFEVDDRIIERCYGQLQGSSKINLTIKKPSLGVAYRRAYDFPPPKGESLRMVELRVFPFCEELVARVKTQKINVALAVHSNSIRAIRRYFENVSIKEEMIMENPLAKDYVRYAIK